MCADRHWKLVYRWISAHITLLEEHPPISGSFLFFSINIIRVNPSNPCSLISSSLSLSSLNKKRDPLTLLSEDLKRKKAASYSPALHCSTIGAGGLNFSVRNGKRWDPAAITTWYGVWQLTHKNWSLRLVQKLITSDNISMAKVFGQLVVLGFDVTVFTPAPYQRHRLWRPSMES